MARAKLPPFGSFYYLSENKLSRFVSEPILLKTKIEEPKSGFVKPFIRWAGGKQNLVKEIIKFQPKKINKYFEPFLGAGSLFLANDFDKTILSDINGHLINSFERIKESPEEIHSKLNVHRKKLSEEYYYKVRSQFNKNPDLFDFNQAARFIFLVHTSFNGIYRVNKQGQYNVPVGKLNPALPSLDHLRQVSKKLQAAELMNCFYDEIDVMVEKNDFIYLDPPYPALNETSFFQHYTIDRFSDSEQKNLLTFVEKLDKLKAKILISNADTKLIRGLFRDFKIVKLETTRFVSCKSARLKVNELLIRNY